MTVRAPMGAGASEAMDAPLVCSIVAAGGLNFCGVVVETSMNVTFPTLMQEFSIGTSLVQWITTGYLLTLAVLIPVFAYLRRRFPTRTLFLAAVGLFLAGTVAGIVAPAFPVLLVARVLQGAGAAIGLPLMYDIIMNRVPKSKVGLMMGVASLIPAVAPTIGPSLGGLMVSIATWRMIFVVLVPVVLAALGLGLYGIRADEGRALENPRFDTVGFALLACGFAAFVLGVNGASSAGWHGISTLGPLGAAALLLALFGAHASKCAHPILSIRPFSQHGFACSLVPVMGVQLIILGLGYLIPNFAQLVLGADSLRAGTIMLPGCILAASLSPVSGRLLDRVGVAVPVCIGMVAVIAAPALYALSGAALTVPLMVGIYLLFGFGQGNTLGNSMTNALGRLPAELSADGNSIANTAQQLASALGTSLAATCVASAQATEGVTASATLSGSVSAFWLLSAVGAVSLVGFLLSLRKQRR